MAVSQPSAKRRFGIQAKLLSTLLLISLLSLLSIGTVAYYTTRNALRNTIFEGLTALRSSQAEQIKAYFDTTANQLSVLSESPDVVAALKEFKTAYQKLSTVKITNAQQEVLDKFYNESYLPQIRKVFGEDEIPEDFLPQATTGRYLQYHYIAANPNPVGKKSKLDAAKDSSSYSQFHARYHPMFRTILEDYGFEDIFLIDDEKNVVYTTLKEPDFATNLRDGPYSRTGLARAVEEVVKSRSKDFVATIDFEEYVPSRGKPASFFATSVFDGSNFLGTLVFQAPSDRFNQIMNVNQKWEAIGLEKTGETYLIGQDSLLRTVPRKFLENPEDYYQAITKGASSAEDITQQVERMRTVGTPILKRKVTTEPGQRAIAGQSGTIVYKDAFGQAVLGSYQPVELGNFNWGLVAKKDISEAFAPINDLTRRFLLTAAILVPLIIALANALARNFVRPIRRLIEGARRVAVGQTDVQVTLQTHDEFGDLAHSFNTMTQSLHSKEQMLQEKILDNDRLLRSLLPNSVADRVKAGTQPATDDFADISVLYAEVEGFNQLSETLAPEESISLLNTLVTELDEVAAIHGVEPLKNTGSSYLAVCGLSTPTPDHVQRMLTFAQAILKVMAQFNQRHGTSLDLDIGVHTGSVVGGIVGKTKFIYELWGDTMNVARAIHPSAEKNTIHVTEAVQAAVQDKFSFQPVAEVVLKGKGSIPVWAVKSPIHQE